MNEINNIFNKHNYLGENGGKANILLTSTIEDEFSITLEDEQNEVKSSWEMKMHREDAEKVIRKAAEMLGVIPIYDCRSCKNNGNYRECVDCHDFCNFVRYVARPQGEWIPIKMRPGTDEEYEEFSQNGDCPREDFRVFDCPLPDDDQKVLVTTQWGDVCVDIWHRDVDCCYFEDNSDDDDVIAWMPLPEGYKKGGAES